MPDSAGTDRRHRQLSLARHLHRLDFTLVGVCLLGTKDSQRRGLRAMLNPPERRIGAAVNWSDGGSSRYAKCGKDVRGIKSWVVQQRYSTRIVIRAVRLPDNAEHRIGASSVSQLTLV